MTAYRCCACNKKVRELRLAKNPQDGCLPVCPDCLREIKEKNGEYFAEIFDEYRRDKPCSGHITRLEVCIALWEAGYPKEDELQETINNPSGNTWRAVVNALGKTRAEQLERLLFAGVSPLVAAGMVNGNDPQSFSPAYLKGSKAKRDAVAVVKKLFSFPDDLALKVIKNELKIDEAKKINEERETLRRQQESRRLKYLESFLEKHGVIDAAAVARKLLARIREAASQPLPQWENVKKLEKMKEEKKLALEFLTALDAAALDAGPGAGEKFTLAAINFGGWKDIRRWARLLAETKGSLVNRRDLEKEKAAARREAAAKEKARKAAEKKERDIAREKEILKAVKNRLLELGIEEALTSEKYRHLLKMLPDEYGDILRLRYAYELWGINGLEPGWTKEQPDPEIREWLQDKLPDDVLAEAWHDRWVTAKTIATELGISEKRAREVMEAVGYIETENPHYSWTGPMKLSRLNAVLRWAGQNKEKIEMWAGASRRAKEAAAARFRAMVEELKSIPVKIAQMTSDPAPLVCFWLTLLNRAAKSGGSGLYGLKDRALRELVKAGVPHDLRYLEGGGKEEKVWLCDRCREEAAEMGMGPLDYIELIGPCPECEIEPARPRYYDLYSLVFTFDGIGKFCYHVPYDIGRKYLPNPGSMPANKKGVRGEEGAWTFGRPLNKIERDAFGLEEIKENLLLSLDNLRNSWQSSQISGSQISGRKAQTL